MKAEITIGKRKASLSIDGREVAALYYVRGWWRERIRLRPETTAAIGHRYGDGVTSISERWALTLDLCAMAKRPHELALAAIAAAEKEALR